VESQTYYVESQTLTNKHLVTSMLTLQHTFKRNVAQLFKQISLRNALVRICDQTHPLTMSISVKENTHTLTIYLTCTQPHNTVCVCVREKVTRRDILQMLHVKEEESSTAIHPSPPSNTPLTRNERAKGVSGGGREGRKLKGKRNDRQRKKKKEKGGEKKL